MALANQGAAAVILEKECTAEVVMQKITELLSDRKAYEDMRMALVGMAVPDCAERICKVMEELTSGKTKK